MPSSSTITKDVLYVAAAINKSSVVNPITSESTEFLELANGCLCCSIKDSGVAAIEALIAREREFDYVVLETTGMADPGACVDYIF